MKRAISAVKKLINEYKKLGIRESMNRVRSRLRGWRPASSAPKTGEFLACDIWVRDGMYSERFHISIAHLVRECDGDMGEVAHGIYYKYEAVDFKWWMPLPEPPK